MSGLLHATFIFTLCVLTGAVLRCEYRNYLIPERPYYMYSPGYPRNYSTEIQCRWVVAAPAGFVCRLNCSELVLPQTPSCSSDRLLVSSSGDPTLATANVYCGRRSFTEVSTGQQLAMSLLTSRWTTGGRFLCEVTAERANLFYPQNRFH